MLIAAVLSLGVVFLAELGDKSQLITLTYALRHRWWVVLTGSWHRRVRSTRHRGDGRPLSGFDAAPAADRRRRRSRLHLFRGMDLAGGQDRHNWAGVWVGATAGMVLADAVAVAVGSVLHRRLPEHFGHAAASTLFLGFGLWMIFDGALGWRAVAITSIAAVALVAVTAVLLLSAARRARHAAGPGSRAR